MSNNPVQPIIVVPRGHLATAAAGAVASGMAFCSLESPFWQEWVGGSYTKSVRRASKQAQIRKVAECELPHVQVELGEVVAFAFAPLPYPAWPKELHRLQVSGIDERVHGSAQALISERGPRIILNQDVGMTTGKTTAQVAHALVAWLIQVGVDGREEWLADPGISLSVEDVTQMAEPSIQIRDNGLTEIEAGTLTVVCR